MTEVLTVDHRRLEELAASMLAMQDVPEADAERIAACLVLADLRGLPSHGIARLPVYAERLRRGLVKPRPNLNLDEPTPVCARLDGDDGFGFVIATRAMDEAMERAQTYGIGMISAFRSTHFGMAACYLLQAVEKGFAAFIFTNASPAMPVWGGREPFLGTSPFAFAAPGTDKVPSIVLDMATSVVARGKIRRAAAKGEPIPEGWALDKEGNPTTDARAAYEGIVLPLAGPKGSGLSLMMEVMGGVMSGAAFAGRVGNQYKDFDAPQNVGHTFVAIRPDVFVGQDYAARMEELVRRAKSSTPIDAAQPVLMPGEPEALREAENRRKGVEMPADVAEALRQEASRLGIRIDDF
ncbi:Ldh family oxidoreductase [Chelativorans sp. YIM 93263]|uniref:Ldh family oxidoreductase n=1 Tax=Chelativorans sp. YIM 93263 TaxID=2906648 RepID=UPI002379CBA8|nr:Ldh family oxidoreductase [Chelativorans sp. YIM 93263]